MLTHRKYASLILLWCLFFPFLVAGQETTQVYISNSTLLSSEDELPFWLWANRDGMVKPGVSTLNFTQIGGNINGTFQNQPNWSYNTGATLVAAFGSESYFQVNELYAAIGFKGWKLEGGKWQDKMQLGGLSVSNGNLARSRNARPVPKIRFSTAGYKSFPGLQEWLAFRFEFDEGFLNDQRVVDNAHLHHKSLYFRIRPAQNWSVEMGAEHFVMWGGTSENEEYGKLPTDFKSYLKYITGRSGGSEFPTTDQKNVAGNQYGTYQLKISREFDAFSLHFNLSHPFEDLSGVNWQNWPDNLLGLYLDFKQEEQFVSDVLYEFVNTRQQGIVETYRWNEETQEWNRRPWDNYFNNSVYLSGATYHQMVMAAPLFFPVKIVDGISRGIRSNRFYAHHLGAAGKCLPLVYWKGMATFTKHFGTYGSAYQPPQKQVSLYAELNYRNPSFPFEIGVSLAADTAIPDNCYGAQLFISKTW
jgi:hypothetical protein